MVTEIESQKVRSTKQWLVVYTRSRSEKKVDELLKRQGIDSYCPTIKVKKQWADRMKTLEVPLFNSYLFVHADVRTQFTIQQTYGVVHLVSHCGKVVTLEEQEVSRIRSIVSNYLDVEAVSLQSLKTGDRIKITEGSFADFNGEVSQIAGKTILMVIKNLDCALTVKVNINQVALSAFN